MIMNTSALLEKFDTVEIKNETRISGDELAFCEAQQDLYVKVLAQHRKAFRTLEKLRMDCETFLASVAEINTYTSGSYSHPYYSCEYTSLSKEDFAKKNIGSAHEQFIRIIIRHFTDKYNVSIEDPEYLLLLNLEAPEDPHRHFYGFSGMTEEEKERFHKEKEDYKNACDTYLDDIINSELHYDMILDHIFLNLDGSSFAERAEQEIVTGSRNAANNQYHNKALYEVKNKRISLDILYAHKDWNNKSEVSLDGADYRAVLRALSYFNSDKRVTEIYTGWHWYTGYNKKEDDGIFALHEVGTGKVQTFKYYKNGKFEVGFDSHASAQRFAQEYLQCSGSGDGQ